MFHIDREYVFPAGRDIRIKAWVALTAAAVLTAGTVYYLLNKKPTIVKPAKVWTLRVLPGE